MAVLIFFHTEIGSFFGFFVMMGDKSFHTERT